MHSLQIQETSNPFGISLSAIKFKPDFISAVLIAGVLNWIILFEKTQALVKSASAPQTELQTRTNNVRNG